MLTRREFVSSAGAALTPPAQRKPNVLFIIADQWRAQTLPAAGRPGFEGPEPWPGSARRVFISHALIPPFPSVRRRAHQCSRENSLMPAGWPHNDLQLPLDERCIGDQLKQAGYSTGYIGKWLLDGEEKPGFVPSGPRPAADSTTGRLSIAATITSIRPTSAIRRSLFMTLASSRIIKPRWPSILYARTKRTHFVCISPGGRRTRPGIRPPVRAVSIVRTRSTCGPTFPPVTKRRRGRATRAITGCVRRSMKTSGGCSAHSPRTV